MIKPKPIKDILYVTTIIMLLAAFGQSFYNKQIHKTYTVPVVFYNRDTKLNNELIKLIQEADQKVYFAVYTFTRYDLKDALLAAKHRGVEVIGITDKDQINNIPNQQKIIKQLKDSGIPVYTQNHNYIMHLKVLVTEKAYASGSYNWTANATDKNDEILEIGTDEATRKKYEDILLKIFDKYK